jgi:hypothetical protein
VSEFFAFFQLGFRHIVAWNAADHILFLLALGAIYRGRDWRAALLVISAFTVGHCITLVLAVTQQFALSSPIVEFLIPVTIVATGVENLMMRDRAATGSGARHRPILALVFGLVHGAGFAGYLQSLFVDRIATPLVGFNIGIEAGQIVVLTMASVVFYLLDRALSAVPRRTWMPAPFQLRVASVSGVIALVAAVWAVERFPA